MMVLVLTDKQVSFIKQQLLYANGDPEEDYQAAVLIEKIELAQINYEDTSGD